jgi:phytanoyl-CoA hydroxylase
MTSDHTPSFTLGDPAIAAAYARDGFVVLRSLVPAPPREALLAEYRAGIVPSRARFYRQSTARYERNRFSPHGHVLQSYQDIHAFSRFPAFQRAALDLFSAEPLLNALRQATGHAGFNLMQSMLFDQNTTTPAHQDWWYLDSSSPNGELVAAWIALEDIRAEAGRFYVMAGSTEVALHRDEIAPSHGEWLGRMRAWVDEHPDQQRAPELAAGDVLLWNSRTVHGSLPTIDAAWSRKSLTAHYLPSHLAFGNLFARKDVVYQRHADLLHFHNQPEWSWLAGALNAVKNLSYDHPAALRLLRRMQGVTLMD